MMEGIYIPFLYVRFFIFLTHALYRYLPSTIFHLSDGHTSFDGLLCHEFTADLQPENQVALLGLLLCETTI
jgi:hypothetical protein